MGYLSPASPPHGRAQAPSSRSLTAQDPRPPPGGAHEKSTAQGAFPPATLSGARVGHTRIREWGATGGSMRPSLLRPRRAPRYSPPGFPHPASPTSVGPRERGGGALAFPRAPPLLPPPSLAPPLRSPQAPPLRLPSSPPLPLLLSPPSADPSWPPPFPVFPPSSSPLSPPSPSPSPSPLPRRARGRQRLSHRCGAAGTAGEQVGRVRRKRRAPVAATTTDGAESLRAALCRRGLGGGTGGRRGLGGEGRAAPEGADSASLAAAAFRRSERATRRMESDTYTIRMASRPGSVSWRPTGTSPCT